MKNTLNKAQNWHKNLKNKPLIIAGPCSAESEKQVMETAKQLDPKQISIFRAGIWKPRTKPGSFEGIGEIGLKWLKKVKKTYGFLTATEVSNAQHVDLAVSNDVDCLWIGARSSVNPFVVQEIAEALRNTDKIVLVKNPVNPDLDLWVGALERLSAMGIKNIGAIHRGFSTYSKTTYRNNPIWQIAMDFKMRFPNIPLLVDPSHICGNKNGLFAVAQQAMNLNYEGIIIETHIDPENAWSDAKQQITPKTLKTLIEKIDLRKDHTHKKKYEKELCIIRNHINELDEQLIDILSKRMKLAKEAGRLKKSYNLTVFQPKRWDLVRRQMIDFADKYKLSLTFVEQITGLLHQESVQIQNQIMLDENNEK